MQNFHQNNKCFVSVVTLCDIFIQDLNDFLALTFLQKDFSLKISYVPFFRCFFCSFISQYHVVYSQEKICHFALSIILKYEKLIF